MADISNTTSNTVITGTADSDSIINYGNTAVSIDAGAGNDTIHNFYNDNITINGGTGDDYVNNSIDWEISRGTVYIYSGGNDTLEMFGADDSFLIIEGYSWATIANDDTGDLLVNVLDGAETVGSISLPRHHDLWPGRLKILSSKEEFDALNLIINAEDNQTLTGTDAKNVITNTADNVTITGGADSDSIANITDRVDRTTNVLIDAGDGNNQIYNTASNVTISAGAGDDSVWNDTYINNAGVVYVYGGGNDTLDNFSANTFVVLGNVEVRSTGSLENVGTVLRLSNGKTLTFTGDNRASLVSSLNEIPAMNITYNAESDIVVTGKQEAGTIDFIFNDNDGNKVTINGNDNADIVYNYFNEKVLINGGAGKDSLANGGSNMTINGGADNDFIRNQDGVNVLINADDGDDEIISSGTNVTINGGKGNDSIRNNGTSVSIDAGAGDDSISNGYSSVTIDSGAGDDTVINDGAAVSISGGTGNDSIRNWGTNVTINGDAGDDYFDIYDSTNALIVYNADDGFDTIDAFNETATLQIGDGTGTYSATKSGDDIILTVGNGKITLRGAATLSSVNILGTGLGDFDVATSIDGGRGNDTLESTHGDNTLTGGKGNDIFLYKGGNDVITDYSEKGTNGADKIIIDSGLTYENYELDGGNVILNYADENSLTIIDGKGKAITFAGNKSTIRIYSDEGILDGKKKSITLKADTNDPFSGTGIYKKLITIDGSQVDNEIAITGNAKANSIVAGKSNTTLNGGKGKDTLVGGEGADVFVYNAKSGNKIIRNYNFDDDDVISLGKGAAISQVTTRKGNVVLKVGTNTITIEDAAKFNFTQDGTTKTYDDGKLIVGDSVTLASDFKGTFSLTGDDAYNHVSAELTKKAVTLIGDAADNSLIGGKGNDSLWGGGGADIFIYQASKGNDVIGDYNFEDGDLLQIIDKRGRTIKDAVKKWTFDGDDLTLMIKGGGKLTLAGVGAKTSINVNGSVQSF